MDSRLQVFISSCPPALTCLVTGSPPWESVFDFLGDCFKYVSIFSALLVSTADAVHASVAEASEFCTVFYMKEDVGS